MSRPFHHYCHPECNKISRLNPSAIATDNGTLHLCHPEYNEGSQMPHTQPDHQKCPMSQPSQASKFIQQKNTDKPKCPDNPNITNCTRKKITNVPCPNTSNQAGKEKVDPKILLQCPDVSSSKRNRQNTIYQIWQTATWENRKSDVPCPNVPCQADSILRKIDNRKHTVPMSRTKRAKKNHYVPCPNPNRS